MLFLFHIDDHCQFWIDETAGVLKSPYFDGINQHYGHNLNCIWTLNAIEGFYINLEIDYFMVNKDKYINFTTFFCI